MGGWRGRGGFAGIAMAAWMMAGCVGAPSRDGGPAQAVIASPSTRPADNSFVNRIVREAQGLIGAPYRLGGEDPAGMDCSGLVSLVFARAGVATPRTALAQQQAAVPVELDQLRPGDLVFFRLPDPHVGIYVGGGEFIHAPGSGRTVTTARLDQPYFLLGFAGGGRFQPSPAER